MCINDYFFKVLPVEGMAEDER